ncbi:MAG TPA: leucyl aminopeptidase family protein [Caulobacteraceae bacterium]|nr:leucyl aminopeptidase family protein [Caulobacteraceae bacterium]
MSDLILDAPTGDVRALHAVAEGDLETFLGTQSPPVSQAAALQGFKGKVGQVLLANDAAGAVVTALGVGEAPKADSFRAGPTRLPAGDYRLAAVPAGLTFEAIALAWAMGGYRFERYRKPKDGQARLAAPANVELAEVRHIAASLALARDLTNTPANDMGPVEMEMAAREVAEAFGAEIGVVIGDELLAQGYPAVHAVGRAADPRRAPRMIEIVWGRPRHPLVALVGKGVVFDSGGLDLKTAAGMRLMKKDMGGAAHALALARMVMAAKLPVRLVALLPVVENAVSGDAMRPGDVLASRKGLSIEIGNTDAEGRLILADALARAAELDPVLTLDFATLTGAARAALGPEVAPFYTDDEALAADLARAAETTDDPLWRMPMWKGYEPALDSDIADVKNDPDAWAQAGSVTAALFLRRFAPKTGWAHFDIFAWIARAGPGRPIGAEAQAIRAAYAMIKSRYAKR